MKYFLFGILSFFLVQLQAQERTLIKGLVRNDSIGLDNVHVRNISTGKYSVSGENGNFQLNLMLGDTLLLTHVGMQDLIAYVKPEDLKAGRMVFTMREVSNELREVLVNETSEINAVSLGIIPKKIEKLTLNERRLRTAGDFKPKHVLGILGGGVSIDAILNAINGRTKRLKRNITYEEKERHITYLELHFWDYMRQELALSEQEARLLINLVIEDDDLKLVITRRNEAEMEFFLLDRWLKIQNELKEQQK
ncbi:hypothetical protein [Salinimicrobium oceani]|uniref:CarboxypepD_reg-like domain-containing protein n=1 Tax=Salinimicrobium oceani TaxID=2722702 RepID=A0ABX1D2L7_9FLAO|nr:hypothetical protein [Salinimicrobium oceani]NJW52796.1 hypothetical protein [Salinimicrobium oceani]